MDLQLPAIQQANSAYADLDRASLQGPPAKHLCILTCMDARIDPLPALGLANGDAHILRNAGGRATDDAIRSIALSAHHLGTREFAVIHHTKCGLHNTTNDHIRAAIAAAGANADAIDFLPFDDLVESVRDDVAAIRSTGLLPSDSVIWGATYDVDSGRLDTVVEPTRVA